MNPEHGFVRLRPTRLMKHDPTDAFWRGIRQLKVVGDRSELAERDFPGVDDSAATVVNVELVFLARLERVAVFRNPADDAPHVDQLSGPIRRPVDIKVTLRREPDGEFQAGQAADCRGGVSFVNGEDAQVGDRLQFFERLLQDAVLARDILGENFFAIADQQAYS